MLRHCFEARARLLLAFTYPRDRWYVRALIVLENFWLRLTGNGFRAFVHPPERMGGCHRMSGIPSGNSLGVAQKPTDDGRNSWRVRCLRGQKIEGTLAVKPLRPLEAEPESFYASRFNLT